MRLIAVEGSIGTGKSTLLPKLAEKLGYTYLLEPVDSDPVFAKLLKAFTDNPTNTAIRLDFQRYITESRANLLKDIPDGNYLIERSLFSDLIFSNTNMLELERPDGIYQGYYYDIIDRLKEYPKVDAIIYLRTTPEVVYDRMVARSRDAEAGTPLHYLQELHLAHEAGLPQICRVYDTPLLTFDWDNFGGRHAVDSIVSKLADRGIL